MQTASCSLLSHAMLCVLCFLTGQASETCVAGPDSGCCDASTHTVLPNGTVCR